MKECSICDSLVEEAVNRCPCGSQTLIPLRPDDLERRLSAARSAYTAGTTSLAGGVVLALAGHGFAEASGLGLYVIPIGLILGGLAHSYRARRRASLLEELLEESERSREAEHAGQ